MELYSTAYQNQSRVVSGTITVNNDDSILYCNTSAGAVVINLIDIPTNFWSTQYKLYIADNSNNASVNNITINAPTGFTINGAASITISTNGGSCIVRISGNTTYICELSTTSSSPSTPFEGTNWSFVYGNGTHTANATQLQNAYTSAKAKTPNGQPLSATNRFTVIVGAGYYQFSSNFLVDANFIDIVSLTGNMDVVFSGAGTIVVSINDVLLRGINVLTKAFSLTSSSPLNVSVICENCKGGNDSFGKDIEVSGVFRNCIGGNLSFGGGTTGQANGTFTDCVGGTSSFGGFGGTASGVFTNCVGGQYAFGGGGGVASGTFVNCEGANYSFGTSGTASGTFDSCKGLLESFGGGSAGVSDGVFVKCEGGDNSFGGGDNTALSDGTYKNCRGGDGSFGGNGAIASGNYEYCVSTTNSFGGGGGTASGNFEYCEATNGSFGGGASGVASGVFNYCKSGNNSFGGDSSTGGTASGEFNYCKSGINSFAGSSVTGGTASGTFTSCIGDANSFGLNGTLSGKCYFCRIASITSFPTVSGGGRTMYCINGNNTTNNQ
jgi:hypothetical protein